MKKLAALLALIAAFCFTAPGALAQSPNDETRTVIEVFERDDCSHYQDFFVFIDDLAPTRDDFEVC